MTAPLIQGASGIEGEKLTYASIYENGNNQSYIGFGAGPELTFGNFKRKVFDYTKFSLTPVSPKR